MFETSSQLCLTGQGDARTSAPFARCPGLGNRCGGVAQLVRVSACHAEGRGFEPRRSRHFSQEMAFAVPATSRVLARCLRCRPRAFADPGRSRVGYAAASQLQPEMAIFENRSQVMRGFHCLFRSHLESLRRDVRRQEFSCFSAANLPLNPAGLAGAAAYTAPAK